MTNLRHLPSVDKILQKVPHCGLPNSVVVQQIRNVLQARREGAESELSIEEEVSSLVRRLATPSLRSVINGTGVVLHTNLGRAPMPEFEMLSGYSNLEYDLATGKRGRRDAHTSHLLEALLNVPAIVVNNNAAAVFIVLNELAAGHEVIISRGELIEIGDGFRIPEIMTRAGVVLREVGTTNRTTLEDYRQAINERTKLILRVHPSNFHISGFTTRPQVDELTKLGVPVYEDLGSGCLVNLRSYGIEEPVVSDSIKAGVSVLTFSCDKLMGGPQAGIIAGDKDMVARIRRNPLYRAFRADKIIVQALQTTLLHLVKQEWWKIPALKMIMEPLDKVRERAELLANQIPGATVKNSCAAVGGGATPDQVLLSCAVEIESESAVKLERALRGGTPPILVRIERGKIVIDCRTVADGEVSVVARALTSALGTPLESA